MSAVRAIEDHSGFDFLKTPYRTWSPEEVLGYFQSRTNVQYFTVVNEPEVTRDKIDQLIADIYIFNEETYHLPQLDWLINPSSDIEWSIMLHKFYYAVGLGLVFEATGNISYAEKWMSLTSHWIDTVPIDFLSSDVTGRRVQNWIFAHYYFVSTSKTQIVTVEFYQKFLKSIQQQVDYLCQHLTPARNHRTLELYCIFLAAVVFPEFDNAGHWLNFAVEELKLNIETDLLEDGVHCELSTDYHHIVLRNFLAVRRLATLNNIKLPEALDNGIKKALTFSMYVHKPDGQIPSLSDGDTGNFLELLAQGYAFYGCEHMHYVATQGQQGIAPPSRVKAFTAGGYYILRSGWGEQEAFEDERFLVFDCGDLGAGNHGHLDVLNFEMAAFGQSLIVDPGRYTYDESGPVNWRVLFRGTSYHNTVQIDQKNQTRYEFHKHKFKIKGPQPDHTMQAFISRPGFDYVHGSTQSHEYPVTHERKIIFVNGEYWLICDVLKATSAHQYDLLFHLSALAQDKLSVTLEQQTIRLNSPHLVMLQPLQTGVTASVEAGFVSPSYGVKHAAPIVKFSQNAAEACFYTFVYPYKDLRPTISLVNKPVLSQNKPCEVFQASCFEITIEAKQQQYSDLIFIAHAAGEFTVDQQCFGNVPVYFKRTNSQGEQLISFCEPCAHNSLLSI